MEVLTRPWSGEDLASKLQEHGIYGVVERKMTPKGGAVDAGDRRSIEEFLQEKRNDEDDDHDVVADEFWSMLRGETGSSLVASSESGEADESPRALFWQGIEEEVALIVDVDDVHSPEYAKFRMEKVDHVRSPQQDSRVSDILDWGNQDDIELAALLESAEAELEKAMQTLQTRARAKMLEDEETKSLMQEWGLNDKAFATNSNLAVAPLQPAPPLGTGLGPVLHMRDGGSLRSMSPTHFQGGGGRLVMQVSSPVVVPSETGATAMDILRRMAMVGMDGLAAQATVAMPFQDITGKGVDQISVEHRDAGFRNGVAALGHGEGTVMSKDGSRSSKRRGGGADASDEYMSLEDLAPMAMVRIEALALEGLKIQAEMADHDAPCVVEVPVAEESSFKRMAGHRVNGTVPVPPLLDGGGGHCAQDDNIMSMAVSLDEWMRLDAGEHETEDQETLAIVAAHEKEVSVYGKHWKNQKNPSMDDTITLAMLVQLRDPLRHNEPVGAPMMALVQAERVMVPPKPKLARRMPSSRSTDAEDKEEDAAKPPRFKIVGVTVAGLKTSSAQPPVASTAKMWGNKTQLQAGSRWLLAQGMQKSTKTRPVLKGKTSPPASQVTVQRGESLWSISARVHGSGAKWRDLAKLNPHIRNPDLIFPDTTIRTH